jgi:hypothetical protein
MSTRQPSAGRQVFVMAATRLPAAARWALALAALGMLLIGWQLFTLFPPEVWRQALTTLGSGGGTGVATRATGAMAPLLVIALVGGVDWLQRRRGRLTLDNSQLRFDSGVPLLGPWLDWQLSLDDVRSGRTALRLTSVALGANALALIRLGWGRAGLRSLRPAAWRLSGEGASVHPEPQPPHRPLGFVNWRHPDNAAWLQQRFDALPLLLALRERGVVLPDLLSMRQGAEGPDLMAHPRLRAVLALLALLTISGALLLHLSRYQHYITPWSRPTWLAMAALIAALTAAWQLVLAPPMPDDRASRWSLRFAQALSTVLMVPLLGWNLYHAPLAWGRAFGRAQAGDYVLDVDAAVLRPSDAATAGPAIAVDLAAPYWRAQQDGSTHPLVVRRGWAGWWTQYDTETMNRRR